LVPGQSAKDQREAVRQRLRRGQAKAFVGRRHHEQLGRFIFLANACRRTRQRDPVVEFELPHQGLELRAKLAFTDDAQGPVGKVAGNSGEGPDQGAVVLLVLEATDRQQGLRRPILSARVRATGAARHDRIRNDDHVPPQRSREFIPYRRRKNRRGTGNEGGQPQHDPLEWTAVIVGKGDVFARQQRDTGPDQGQAERDVDAVHEAHRHVRPHFPGQATQRRHPADRLDRTGVAPRVACPARGREMEGCRG
jgi:hypothetical protein